MKVAREARTYLLEFEPDGSFRADDVPRGTYELSIQVNKPGEQREFGPLGSPKGDLGSFVREVVVPPGEGPFDLGTLIVPIKGESGGKKPAPVDFTAQTLDGQPISLDQFKGKYVLLAFWGSWSERSQEGLAELQKLKLQFANDSRIDFLAVSLDRNIAEARTAAESKQNAWKQAWLSPQKAARVTAAFDINTVPAVFLIDPDGRIVGRDLEGERLQSMLQRALAAK
jgi:peroxiredoxin